MPRYKLYGTVTGNKYLGEIDAANEAEAREKAYLSEEAYISLCHQCGGECEGAEVTEVVAEEVKDGL